MLDPGGGGVVLRELAAGERDDAPRSIEGHGAGRGGALIDREYEWPRHGGAHGSGRNDASRETYPPSGLR